MPPFFRVTHAVPLFKSISDQRSVDLKLRRPKGTKGRVVTDWLRHEDARGIVQAADDLEPEFGLLLRFLLFTGLRLGEVLAPAWRRIADTGV